jgi:ABC-type polysaccharide/polyol phosphate export permease
MYWLPEVLAYRTLVKYLVLKDIKVKSRGTVLGVLWTLMNPLLTIGMYFASSSSSFGWTSPTSSPSS